MISKIYHVNAVIVEKPEIRIEKFNKDFYFGFYCTIMETQAIRWAADLAKALLMYIKIY